MTLDEEVQRIAQENGESPDAFIARAIQQYIVQIRKELAPLEARSFTTQQSDLLNQWQEAAQPVIHELEASRPCTLSPVKYGDISSVQEDVQREFTLRSHAWRVRHLPPTSDTEQDRCVSRPDD